MTYLIMIWNLQNDLIDISKSTLILAANGEGSFIPFLKTRKTTDKIKDADGRIDNLIYREVWINRTSSQRRQNDESGWQIFILLLFLLNI